MIHTFSKETEDRRRKHRSLSAKQSKGGGTNVRFLSAINKMVFKPIPKSLNSVFQPGFFSDVGK